jgi:hypothetical protein
VAPGILRKSDCDAQTAIGATSCHSGRASTEDSAGSQARDQLRASNGSHEHSGQQDDGPNERERGHASSAIESHGRAPSRRSFFTLAQQMNSEDALSLHNAFRLGGKWHATHAFSCEEPPRDDLLTLDSVYLVSPSAEWITSISESKQLKCLAIKTPRTSDLRPLGKLALTQFEVSYPTRVEDWVFLSRLSQLRRLVVENATTFSDLSCLRNLHTVEFLGVSGGDSKPLRADSLRALAGMKSLRAIFLANIRLKDWDLSTLRQLKHLELLYTPKWCPAEEVSALRSAIPALTWNWDRN